MGHKTMEEYRKIMFIIQSKVMEQEITKTKYNELRPYKNGNKY